MATQNSRNSLHHFILTGYFSFIASISKEKNRKDDFPFLKNILTYSKQKPAWVFQHLGEQYVREKNLEEATNLYLRFLQKYPDAIEAHRGVIQSLLHNSREKAFPYMQDARKKFPLDMGIRFLEGKYWQKKANYDKAQPILEEVCEQSPGSFYYGLTLANNYFWQEDFDKARQLHEDLIRQFPDRLQPYVFLAKMARKNRQWEAAKKHLEKVIGLAPDALYALQELGWVLMELKAWQQAEEAFKAMISKDPNAAGAYLGLANLNIQRHQPEDAIKWLDWGISRTSSVQAYKIKAKLLVRHTQFEEGLALMDEVISLLPEDADLLCHKSYLLILARRYEEAVEIMRPLQARHPEKLHFTHVLSRALIASKQVEEASQRINQLPDLQATSSSFNDKNFINTILKTWQRCYLQGAKAEAPKVFGIGLSKTGTTSLTEAMLHLGYGAMHYINPIHRQLIDLEDIYYGDAFTDSNIAFRFEELYALFPNAKFIYTERDLSSWGNSISNMYRPWGFDTTQGFKEWLALPQASCSKMDKLYHDYDPVFKQAYGSLYAEFPDWETAYLTFEERVNRFFVDKPAEKLLRINLSGDDSWEKLCAFLDKPVPEVPFPHSNKKLQ